MNDLILYFAALIQPNTITKFQLWYIECDILILHRNTFTFYPEMKILLRCYTNWFLPSRNVDCFPFRIFDYLVDELVFECHAECIYYPTMSIVCILFLVWERSTSFEQCWKIDVQQSWHHRIGLPLSKYEICGKKIIIYKIYVEIMDYISNNCEFFFLIFCFSSIRIY